MNVFQVLCIPDESILNGVCLFACMNVALSWDLSQMSLASLYLVGQYWCWLNQFQFAVKPETKHLSGWARKGWMDFSCCWGLFVKSAPWSFWSSEFTRSSSLTCTYHLIWITLRVVLLYMFPALAVCVPTDEYHGAQPTKNKFSRESCCLRKNATKISHWIMFLSSDRLCYLWL